MYNHSTKFFSVVCYKLCIDTGIMFGLYKILRNIKVMPIQLLCLSCSSCSNKGRTMCIPLNGLFMKAVHGWIFPNPLPTNDSVRCHKSQTMNVRARERVPMNTWIGLEIAAVHAPERRWQLPNSYYIMHLARTRTIPSTQHNCHSTSEQNFVNMTHILCFTATVLLGFIQSCKKWDSFMCDCLCIRYDILFNLSSRVVSFTFGYLFAQLSRPTRAHIAMSNNPYVFRVASKRLCTARRIKVL